MEHEKLYNFLQQALTDSYDYEIRHWQQKVAKRINDYQLISVFIFSFGGLALSYYLMRQHYPAVMYFSLGIMLSFSGYQTLKALSLYEIIATKWSDLGSAHNRVYNFLIAEKCRLSNELLQNRSNYEFLEKFYKKASYKAPELELMWDLTNGRKKLVVEDRNRV